MKKLSLGLALLAVCATSTTFAATGVVTFNGLLVSGTCNASVTGGGAAGGADATVTLPTVNISALDAANDIAGTTAFKIGLTGATASECQAGGMTATPYFESEIARVNAAGRLINTGGATNVDVQLLTNNQTAINVNDTAQTQASSTSVAVTNGFEYSYFARYFATAATTIGTVNSSVSYSIIYK